MHPKPVCAQHYDRQITAAQILLRFKILICREEHLKAVSFSKIEQSTVGHAPPALIRDRRHLVVGQKSSQPPREMLIKQYFHAAERRACTKAIKPRICSGLNEGYCSQISSPSIPSSKQSTMISGNTRVPTTVGAPPHRPSTRSTNSQPDQSIFPPTAPPHSSPPRSPSTAPCDHPPRHAQSARCACPHHRSGRGHASPAAPFPHTAAAKYSAH